LDVARDLVLEQREEAAVRGDAVGAQINQLARAVQKSIEEAVGALAHHPLRRSPLDHLVEHRERPGLGVAHVAWNAREPRLQHQDAEGGAVDRLAAVGDALVVGAIRHRHRPAYFTLDMRTDDSRYGGQTSVSFSPPAFGNIKFIQLQRQECSRDSVKARADRPCEDGRGRPLLCQASVAIGSSTASKPKFSSPIVSFTATYALAS